MNKWVVERWERWSMWKRGGRERKAGKQEEATMRPWSRLPPRAMSRSVGVLQLEFCVDICGLGCQWRPYGFLRVLLLGACGGMLI